MISFSDFEDRIKPKDVICDPPKCPRGCSIEKEFDGPCPGCDCKGKGTQKSTIFSEQSSVECINTVNES